MTPEDMLRKDSKPLGLFMRSSIHLCFYACFLAFFVLINIFSPAIATPVSKSPQNASGLDPLYVQWPVLDRPHTAFKLNALSAPEPTRLELETRLSLPRLPQWRVRVETESKPNAIQIASEALQWVLRAETRLQRLDADGSVQRTVHIPHPKSFDSRSEYLVIMSTPFDVAFKGF